MADLRKTRLIRILRSFDRQEMDRLQHYLTINFGDSQKKILALFDFYFPHYPDFSNPVLQKKNAFFEIYGGEVFSDGKFRTLQSRLREEVSLFIQLEYFKKDSARRELLLLNYFADRRMELDFEYPLRKLEQRLDLKETGNGPPKNFEELLYHKFLLEKVKNRWEGILRSKEQERINQKDVVVALDEFFVLQKLEYLCLQLNSVKSTTIKEEINIFRPLANRVIANCREEKTKLFLEMFLFSLEFLLEEKENIDHYHRLKNRLQDIRIDQLLSTNHRRNICTYLQNATRALFRIQSKHRYFSELFELYQLQEFRGVFDDFNLNPKLCINICTSALELLQIKWLENFLLKRKSHLLKFGDGSYFIFLAEAKFAQGNREEAQNLLWQMDETITSTRINHYNRVRRRRLDLKMLYQEKNPERFLNQLASFRKYLTDNKPLLNQIFIEENAGFAKVARRFGNFNFQLGEKEKIEEIKKIENFIKNLDHLVERVFFQKQLEALLPDQVRGLLMEKRREVLEGKARAFLDLQHYLEEFSYKLSPEIMESYQNFLYSVRLLQGKNSKEDRLSLESKLSDEFFPVEERRYLLEMARQSEG